MESFGKLGEHSEVAEHFNPVVQDGLHLLSLAHAAFEFYRFCACADQRACILDGLIGVIVAVDREVGHQQSVLVSPGSRGGVMQHVFQGDVGRIGEPEHHHTQRITDEDEIGPGFVQQPRSGVVPGGESRDGRASLLAGAERGSLFVSGHGWS